MVGRMATARKQAADAAGIAKTRSTDWNAEYVQPCACVQQLTTMFVSREGLALLGHQGRQVARRCGRRVG